MSAKSKLIPYWMLFVVVGAILLWLNSALCLFHGRVPLGKMSDEAVMLSKQIYKVLIVNGYCANENDCSSKEALFFDDSCTEIVIDIYNPWMTGLDPATISEIIATIARHSTYSVHVSFYSALYRTSCCFLTPITEAYITRRNP